MKRSLCVVLLAALVLTTGCSSLLERSYASVTPHRQFSDEKENPSILRAETYQGLVSALLYLVGKGEEDGVIRLYQYVSVTGSAASDVDAACLEVSKEDPLGAYALDYIKYDVSQSASYYQVAVTLAYTRSQEELRSVISVTGSSAIHRELLTILPNRPSQAVFRISYFTQEDSAEGIRQAVVDACAQIENLPPLADIQVQLYPDSGQQRLAEIRFTWAPAIPSMAGTVNF